MFRQVCGPRRSEAIQPRSPFKHVSSCSPTGCWNLGRVPSCTPSALRCISAWHTRATTLYCSFKMSKLGKCNKKARFLTARDRSWRRVGRQPLRGEFHWQHHGSPAEVYARIPNAQSYTRYGHPGAQVAHMVRAEFVSDIW
jgi:hypothetical protein